MRRHITLGCAIAAGALFITACSSSSGIPPTYGGSALLAQTHGMPLAANVLKNPCFSTGKLAPWKIVVGTGAGKAVVSKKEKWDCPTYSALMGTTSPPAPDGLFGIEQSVKIPAKAKLTWWYYAGSDDEAKYASQQVNVMSGKTLVHQCFKELETSKKWTEASCDLSKYAGKTYDIEFAVDDNGYSKTYDYWYVDDISLE
jgi:hypothetical protein